MDQQTQVEVEQRKAPVIEPGHSFATITDKISSIVLTRPTGLGWIFGFLFAFMLVQVLLFAIGYLFVRGVGIWGINIPIGWGFAIVNFVWWIGIGHAGTLISAILLLLRQSWRNSINRFAEAMTLFAVACAGMFPVLHMGRPWLAYWLFPYPNTMNYWPQFRSPLVWDVFAVSTYATTSALFWFVGLIPDLATLRDRATNPVLKCQVRDRIQLEVPRTLVKFVYRHCSQPEFHRPKAVLSRQRNGLPDEPKDFWHELKAAAC